MYFKIYLTQVDMVNYRRVLNFPSSYRCIPYAYQNYDLIMVNNMRTCTFENSVEFENSETNLIQSFKKYKLDIPNETCLALNPDQQQMKPDHWVMDL